MSFLFGSYMVKVSWTPFSRSLNEIRFITCQMCTWRKHGVLICSLVHIIKVNYNLKEFLVTYKNWQPCVFKEEEWLAHPSADSTEMFVACWTFHTYFMQGIMGAEVQAVPSWIFTHYKNNVSEKYTHVFTLQKMQNIYFCSFNQHLALRKGTFKNL